MKQADRWSEQTIRDNAHYQFGDTISDNEYAVINNTWGRYKLDEDDTYRQSVYCTPHKMEAGWNWQCCTEKKYVKGFPQILYGVNPYSRLRTAGLLPIRISDIHHGAVVYKTHLSAVGQYNLALDFWITSDAEVHKEKISHEIMVWTMTEMPIGSVLVEENIRIGFYTYDLYRNRHGAGHWFLMFVKQGTSLTSQIFPFTRIFDYLIEKEYLDPSHYLAAVELGTEIWNGDGHLHVENFHVVVKPLSSSG